MKDSTKLMDKYLELDKGERVPIPLTIELLASKDCRKQMKMLRFAEKTSAEPLSVPVSSTDSTIAAVMAKIDPSYAKAAETKPISITKWIVVGIMIIAFMVGFCILSYKIPETNFKIRFYIISASAFAIYCGAFVSSNMDFFIKRIEILKR